ncbi:MULTISPECIES: hypothetical protein [unclassified Desulfovibrio]|uniref:hypothetical protein n=1 Tax=unclassified Desulfovibrio TaxID=2593640 RepID=UPI000F5ECD80|nr:MULTISPECIES: hypothetical protein [unclassified Desulfovibrio]RRD71950.1 hypothetical protein EII24_01855 [Desulfovibrio sp. OH1209_COT-279]RRD88163.1 hypothetical protein EII23_01855 [Desulfovibrio sp. OH1186_COT-070]
MNNELVKIIKPGLFSDQNSYWAMHYCAIFETLYDQKTIEHGFQKKYMLGVEPTLENLAAKAGFAFFYQIRQSLQNFGLQWLLCHFLLSSQGEPIFRNIVENLSSLYDYDFTGRAQEYGIFISGKDFLTGANFAKNYNPILAGHGFLTLQDVAEKVAFADMCFFFKKEENTYAILGEVEGNYGARLLTSPFWEKKKGQYYSFGIGVKKKDYTLNTVNEKVLPPVIIGQWVRTPYGDKYVIIIESDHDVIKDFHNAIGTVQLFMTMGPNQRANYDPTLLPVLNLIKQHWDKDIVELILQLRNLFDVSKFATLGTNQIVGKTIPIITA